MSKHSEQSMYFVVFQKSPIMYGATWKVYTDRTSFYLSCRHQLKDWKFSLHGPDPDIDRVSRDPNSHVKKFKWAPVRNSASDAPQSIAFDDRSTVDEPIYFTGHEVADGVKHVLRFRWPWHMFLPGSASAPSAGAISSREQKRLAGARILPVPEYGLSTDVDLYISDGEPYWPNKAEVVKRNAGLPPLKNAAGQWMTGVVMKNRLDQHPTPHRDGAQRRIEMPTTRTSHVRGLYQVGSPEGYVVVEETWIPQGAIDAALLTRGENVG